MRLRKFSYNKATTEANLIDNSPDLVAVYEILISIQLKYYYAGIIRNLVTPLNTRWKPNRKTSGAVVSLHGRRLYHIKTTCKPIADHPRRFSGDKLAAAKAEIDFLLDHGICRPFRNASNTHDREKNVDGDRVVITINLTHKRFRINLLQPTLTTFLKNYMVSQFVLLLTLSELTIRYKWLQRTFKRQPFVLHLFGRVFIYVL